MLFRGFIAGLVLLCASTGVVFGGGKEEGGLWLIHQDFVKFGKKEAYEKYKKELLVGFWNFAKQSSCCTFAQKELDSPQYIYLTPIGDFSSLGDLMKKRQSYFGTLGANALLPYLSTINFAIESLHRFIPECSYVPKGKESIMSYGATHFYLFGVMPVGIGDFEAHLQKIASAQAESSSGVCIRSWKVVIGGDVPKYLVAVFADTDKDAEQRAKSLELAAGPIKNILRSQKEATALLRQDLSRTHR